MTNICEKIRVEIPVEDVIREFGGDLDRHLKMKCPFHDDHNPSFSVDKKRNKWHCFVCEEDGSSIDYVMKIMGVSESDAIKEIMRRFNMNDERDYGKVAAPNGNVTAKVSTVSAPKVDTLKVKAYLTQCNNDVSKTDYFRKRGLSNETVSAFHLGYDVARKSVTIPYDSTLTYYQTRTTEGKLFYKMPTSEDGEPIFNGDRIKKGKGNLLFVVESPICAMSIEQCGYNAVAVCGVSVEKLAAALISNDYSGKVALCFDNDDAGKKAYRKIARLLKDSKIKYAAVNIAGEYKDPNELLVANSEELMKNMHDAEMIIDMKCADYKDSISAEDIMSMSLPPRTWIIDDFMTSGLMFLVGKSKCRKSWMALQMAIAVVNGSTFLGHECKQCGVLYYALEDTHVRLQERLQKVVKPGENIKDLHITIKADRIKEGLLDKMDKELEKYPNIKLVIVDTLQKVRGSMSRDKTIYGHEYSELSELKEFADDHDICLLFVHHTRKTKDEVDAFNNMNGSTAMEGANDNMIILDTKRRNDLYATMERTGRDAKGDQTIIKFNEETFCWELAEGVTNIAKVEIDSAYKSNIYMNTIKKLVNSSTNHCWEGSATDIKRSAQDGCTDILEESATSVGKLIGKYDKLLLADGIRHTRHKSNSRTHIFTRI